MSIDVEALRNSKLHIDSDRYRRRYYSNTEDYSVTFVSPSLEIFDHNRFYILNNSVVKDLELKYHYRPDYLSFDEYGTTVGWYFILYINDIFSIEEFDIEKVYIPSFTVLFNLSNKFVGNLDTINLDLLNKPIENVQELNLYKSRFTKKVPEEVVTVETDMPSFVMQKYMIDSNTLVNKFIDLPIDPIQATLQFKVVGSSLSTFQDIHFALINDTNGKFRRVSWDAADCSLGDGLEGNDALLVNDIIEVTYAVET